MKLYYTSDNQELSKQERAMVTEIVIQEGVTSIDYYAFSGCSNLTSVTIPASVTRIGDDAFPYCRNLKLRVESGSYAEEYARKNGYKYEVIE